MLKRHAELLEEFREGMLHGMKVQRIDGTVGVGSFYIALYYPVNHAKILLDLSDNPASIKVRQLRLVGTPIPEGVI